MTESSNIITQASLVNQAHTIMNNMLRNASKADTRRGWNKFTGQTPSKNDIINNARADLQLLNEVADALGLEHVWSDKEQQANVGTLTQ